MPLWGTHEIIKVPERGGSILIKYTKRLFKFVDFSNVHNFVKTFSVILYFLYIKYSFRARCSIEFVGGVNKTYYSVRQISRIQYKLTIHCVKCNNSTSFIFAKRVCLPKQAAAKHQIISHQTF